MVSPHRLRTLHQNLSYLVPRLQFSMLQNMPGPLPPNVDTKGIKWSQTKTGKTENLHSFFSQFFDPISLSSHRCCSDTPDLFMKKRRNFEKQIRVKWCLICLGCLFSWPLLAFPGSQTNSKSHNCDSPNLPRVIE